MPDAFLPGMVITVGGQIACEDEIILGAFFILTALERRYVIVVAGAGAPASTWHWLSCQSFARWRHQL